MTIRHMKIFVSVYQAQSITRAAEQLHMTQPAVSRAIQELEHYYGVCLFERIGRRICSTESAARLYAQALHIIETLDSMEKGLRDWDEFGVLRVGATITLGNFLLPELAARFQQRHPHLQLRAVVSNGAQLSQHLLENTIDLALIEVSGSRVRRASAAADSFVGERQHAGHHQGCRRRAGGILPA